MMRITENRANIIEVVCSSDPDLLEEIQHYFLSSLRKAKLADDLRRSKAGQVSYYSRSGDTPPTTDPAFTAPLPKFYYFKDTLTISGNSLRIFKHYVEQAFLAVHEQYEETISGQEGYYEITYP